MQQPTVNILADMGAQPGTLDPSLVTATATTDTTAPVAVITSPAHVSPEAKARLAWLLQGETDTAFSAVTHVDVETYSAFAFATPVAGVDFHLRECSGLTLSPSLLATGAVGDAYRQRFTASGGVSPHRFMLVTGTLPEGLTLNASEGVLDAFVSYAREDSEFVHRLVDRADAAERSIYADFRDIPVWSPDWQADLDDAIDRSGAFLLVLTPNSLRSPNVAIELRRAIGQGKRLKP
jgi:hypothetical protein